MSRQFYAMTYSNSGNLGDHIQTIATEQFINRKGGVDRDTLNLYKGKDINLLMQGWFGNLKRFKYMFPPSNNINPIFVGFHISNKQEDREYYSMKIVRNYLEKYQPIGCRDISTKEFLEDLGIEAYFSRCLTTTFPTRNNVPSKEKIFIVDCVSDLLIPSDILNKAEKLTHVVSEEESQKNKESKAYLLLNRYKEEASLVITSRLHCASPCIAMGIPVIFIDNKHDIRFTAINDLLPIQHVNRRLFRFKVLKPLQYIYAFFFKQRVDWNPVAVDVTETKKKIIENVYRRVKENNEEKF